MPISFRTRYQPIQGDTEIIARVTLLLQATHAGAKAGVMIRESLNTGARHASMFATGGNGWTFQYRDVTNGMSFVSADSGGNAPGWVRLVRAGDRLTGYHSTDGKSWSVVGSETIDMSSSVYVGLAVSSRVATVTTAATFTNVAVSKGSSGSNAPPTVSITSPATSATYTSPARMIVTATASDSDGTVARVDIYQGSTLLKSDTTVLYSVAWDGVSPGTYQLTAVARDNDGATRTSAAVTVTVKSASNQAPTVSISSPAAGSSFTAPANIAVQAATSDADGRVTRVEFYRGTTLIGSDSTAPYTVTWTGAPVGTYTLTAKAFDEDGASRTSSGVSVTVRSAQNQLPTVSITSPSTGATFTAPASVTINATAKDTDGTIVGVDFYVGSQLIGTDTTSPYAASWTNVAAGDVLVDRAGARQLRRHAHLECGVRHRQQCDVPATRLVFVPSADHATVIRCTPSRCIAPVIPLRQAPSRQGTLESPPS